MLGRAYDNSRGRWIAPARSRGAAGTMGVDEASEAEETIGNEGTAVAVELELASPEDLWAEACATAMLTVGIEGFGCTVRADGVRTGDVGNGWHGMSWVEGGRAVLYGYDVDRSETRHQAPPVDLLAGGPDWLPWRWLIDLMSEERTIQYVYWWDGSSWFRTDHPPGDGPTRPPVASDLGIAPRREPSRTRSTHPPVLVTALPMSTP
jgi:hypothetical protein